MTASAETGRPRGDNGEVLSQVIQLLTEPLPFREFVQRVTELVRVHLPVDCAQLWLGRDPSGSRKKTSDDDPFHPSLGQKLLDCMKDSPGPLLLRDLRQDPRIDPSWSQEAGWVSLLGVPVMLDGTPAGVLACITRQTRVFSPQEVALVQQVSRACSVALDNAHRRDEQERQRAEARQLAEIAPALGSARHAGEVLKEVCRRAARLCGADRGTIYLWGEKAGNILPAMSQLVSGETQQDLWDRFKGAKAPLEEVPYLARLMDTRQPVNVEDARTSPLVPRSRWEAFRIKSLLSVPLIANDEVVGALIVDVMEEVRPFGPRQVALAVAVADQVALALQKAFLLRETEDRLRQTEARLEIARALTSTLELKPLLKQVAQQAARASGMDRCSIFLRQDEWLVPVMAQYSDGRADPEQWTAFKQLAERSWKDMAKFVETLKQRRPVVIENPASEPWVPSWVKAFGHQALVLVPLIRQETVMGALVFENLTRTTPVRPEEVALATTTASQVALAIDNANLYHETQQRLRESRVLLSLAQDIGSSLNRHEIARRTSRELTKLLGADTSIFYEVESEAGLAVTTAGYHLPDDVRVARKEGLSLEERRGLLAEAFRTGRPLASSDVANDPRLDHPSIRALPQPRSLLFAPVTSGGRELGGLLSFWWSESHDFNDDELRLAGGIAHHMALVLENAHHYERAQQALADLKAAQERLIRSEKLQALAEMSGGVAHDFNNLLTAILGQTEILRRQFDETKTTKDVEASLAAIELAARDGAETVRRLLDFTRAKPRDEVAEAVNLSGLLTHLKEVSRPRWEAQARSRGIMIELHLEPKRVSPVLGNPAELREVLLNLVYNAIDAMPQGGTLTLATSQEEDRVGVAVRDTGLGMSEEVRQRIFDPFYTTKGEGSSGLGLSSSYGIIQRHGGEIEVESKPGQGTRFQIWLPAKPG